MALVDYSDSDGSDTDAKVDNTTASAVTKSGFQKVVDRSNPGKIKVTLPQTASGHATDTNEPPKKRAKTGGGALSGFNSFLPAPKRPAAPANGTLGGGNVGKTGGLGKGVNLKTSAMAGFTREADPSMGASAEDTIPTTSERQISERSTIIQEKGYGDQKPADEVTLVGKPLMFKPLSVNKKTKKKNKPSTPAMIVAAVSDATAHAAISKPQRPKVSLFSMSAETSSMQPHATGEYQALLHGSVSEGNSEPQESLTDAAFNEFTESSARAATSIPASAPAQSLNDIASDLNLSAADRRQLFGRQRGSHNNAAPQATKIINFNTDQEYLHNEELRASGEQVAHNPVRAIAPGKHNLKQLVNAAASQKEALEESFAKGRNNRAEASSRYGW